MLPYAQQVIELEKLARLEPARFAQHERPLPRLGPKSPKARCLVCGRAQARPCERCGFVSYCAEKHQVEDERFHRVVCESFRELAEDRKLRARVGERALVRELLDRAALADRAATLGSFEDYVAAFEPRAGASLTGARLRVFTDLSTRVLTLAGALAGLGVLEQHAPDAFVRVHLLAAAGPEQAVPLELWSELLRFFPQRRFELTLVGPELSAAREVENPERTLLIRSVRALYDVSLWSSVGEPTLMLGYDCGLILYPSWESTMRGLVGRGIPLVLTSYRAWEAELERELLSGAGFQCLAAPQPNRFASRSARPSSTLVNDLSFDNAIVSAWR